MLFTFVVPFVFMVFMSMSMNRVWAFYNMMQLLVNLLEYSRVTLPANLEFVLEILYGMANFSILDQP